MKLVFKLLEKYFWLITSSKNSFDFVFTSTQKITERELSLSFVILDP